MYKLLYIVILLLFTTNNNIDAKDYYPNNEKYYTFNNNYNIFNDIDTIEEYSLNRNYNKENIIKRIERLEVYTFGTIQTGTIESRYQNVKNMILLHPQSRHKTSFLKNISKLFLGEITGHTPSITSPHQYNNYYTTQNNNISRYNIPDNFGSKRYIQSNRPFGNSSNISNFGVGNSSSIKILD